MGPSQPRPDEEIEHLAPLLHRLSLPEALLSPLLAHAHAVQAATDRLGLVSPRDAEIVVSRHTADSLLFALVRRPLPGERWLDVGSGAGFPGLVLACCFPETGFILVEPMKRRAGFLELQAATLGLENVTVESVRVEEREPGFDVAVARALSDPGVALETLVPLLVPGGVAIVAAGPDAPVPQGATVVRLAETVAVDSPGVLFMMSRD